MRRLLAASFVLALAPPAAAQAPASAPSFRSAASELIVLPVTVTDRRGQLVAGLPRERFTVYEDGKAREPALFSNEDAPVSTAVVIDDSGSMHVRLGQVIAATLAFARWSNPQDEMFVVEFNDRVRDALDGRSVAAADEAELHAALKTLVPQGQTALYDALMAGLDRLDGSARARKVMIVISDGGDNVSRATLDEVLDRARRAGVTIYTIGLFDERPAEANPGVLEDLAETTGGQRFLPRSPGPLMQACERIAREIRSGYTIGLVPQHRDGAFHTLSVAVQDSDGRRLRVRTRPGYFAGR